MYISVAILLFLDLLGTLTLGSLAEILEKLGKIFALNILLKIVRFNSYRIRFMINVNTHTTIARGQYVRAG